MAQTQNVRFREKKHEDSFITAFAFGGFLIILGSVFVLNPGLWQKATDFLNNITTATFPFGGATSTIALPAPTNPAVHTDLYNALIQFDVAFGIFQLIILAVRVRVHSQINRIAETLANAVFWLGAAALVNIFLLTGTQRGWFEYWAALILLVGISFIARAFVHFAKRK